MSRAPGHSLKQHPPRGDFDAIVIGSGIGGLVTAALLSREAGKRVLVLERHYRLGGYTQVFTRPGYEWDVGVHYVGGMQKGAVLRVLFDRVSAGRLDWAPLPDVYDAIEIAGRRFELQRGRGAFIERLAASFLGQRPALEAYVELVTSASRKCQMALIDRLAGAPAPRLAAFRLQAPIPEWARQTTFETLTSLGFAGLQLAALAGQFGNYGPSPRRSSFVAHASVVAHYLDGGWYPVGGSSAFAKTLAPQVEAAGGHLATCAEVSQILIDDGRAAGVALEDGRTFRAPLVVSNAGASNTFTRLLPERHRPLEVLEALGQATPSSAYLCLYVGLDRTDAELGLTGTNLWLHPTEDFDLNCWRFDRDPAAPFPLLYVSFPSAKDPDYQRRFPGRATLEVVTTARWDWFERWAGTRWQKRGPQYDAFKGGLKARMLEALLQRLPQLEGHVAHAELSTPLSAAHFAGHPRGEIYGVESTPDRYRVPLRAQTGLPGLYFTGADLATPGVAGAAFAGALTAAAILGPKRLWEWVPLDSTFGRPVA